MRVAVSGAAGRMGRMAAATIAEHADLELAGAYDPAAAAEAVAGVPCTADRSELECEVVVEFTTPTVVIDNLAEWARRGFHAVVGTSGFDADRLGRHHLRLHGDVRYRLVRVFPKTALDLVHGRHEGGRVPGSSKAQETERHVGAQGRCFGRHPLSLGAVRRGTAGKIAVAGRGHPPRRRSRG